MRSSLRQVALASIVLASATGAILVGCATSSDDGFDEDGYPAVDASTKDGSKTSSGDASTKDSGKDSSTQPEEEEDAGEEGEDEDSGVDAGKDSGVDAGKDSGVDSGTDAGVDSGTDAGVDAGTDAGVDAGTDAGTDAGGGGTCDGKVVISQVYGGGNNSGATYQNDFIELHNRGSVAVDVSTWSVQYGSAANAFNGATPLTGSIPAGGYYLVKQSGGTTNGVALPTADVTGTLNLSATDGKVALVKKAAALGTNTCNDADIVDVVGFGSASCARGTAAAAGSNTKSVTRKGSGCTDTANNSADFSAETPVARNSATAAFVCTCN